MYKYWRVTRKLTLTGGIDMKKYAVPFGTVLMLLFVPIFSLFAEETSSHFVYQQGPPIPPTAVRKPQHRTIATGMVCAECHDIKYDAVSTATKQYMLNYKMMDKEAVWQNILDFLPGRERFVSATVYNNEPTNTTIDFVLDPEEKVFYAVCEKGTEKLSHIRLNPVVSAVHYEGWTVAEGGKKTWKSVQVKGKAEIIEAMDPRFPDGLKKYRLARMTPEMAQKRFVLLKISIEKVVFFNSDLMKTGYLSLPGLDKVARDVGAIRRETMKRVFWIIFLAVTASSFHLSAQAQEAWEEQLSGRINGYYAAWKEMNIEKMKEFWSSEIAADEKRLSEQWTNRDVRVKTFKIYDIGPIKNDKVKVKMVVTFVKIDNGEEFRGASFDIWTRKNNEWFLINSGREE